MKLKGVLSNKNIVLRIVVWFLLILVMTLPTMIIWRAVVGPDPSLSALKTFQVLQTFAVFIVPVLVLAYLSKERPLAWLHLTQGMSLRTVLWVMAMILVLSPGINLLSWLNEQVNLPEWLSAIEAQLQATEEAADALTRLFAEADTIPELLLNLVIMALLPAIGEELCFRGGCQGLFPDGTAGPMPEGDSPYSKRVRLRARTHVAVWVTAFLFSAMHFQFYGFIPRMLLGALLGYLLCFSGSLYVPMLAHFTNNAFAVSCFYLSGKGLVSEEAMETFGSGGTWWMGVISLIAGCLMMYFFARQQSSARHP